jgi:hypothetical protein
MRPLHVTNTTTSAQSAQPLTGLSPVSSVNKLPPRPTATATPLFSDPSALPKALRNFNYYYHNCSARLLGADRFEDDLYDKPVFRVFMAVLPICVWVGVTAAANIGWTI